MISSQTGSRFLTKLRLIPSGFLVGLIIAEVSLRLIGYSYPEFYQLDHSRGYCLRPGVEGWYRKEGGSYVRIKSDEVPYFVYRDGRLVADDSFKSSRDFLWRQTWLAALGRWLKDHLRLVQGIDQAARGFKNLLSLWRAKENPGVVMPPVDKKAD